MAILANNGVLFSESAVKGAHFIELACQRRMPLLFLQNISGFMVGGKYEAEGIAKHGAKLVTAVATAQRAEGHRADRRQLRRRQLRHVRPRLFARFLFTWPNSRISVMGGEQAASVLATVHRDADKWTPGGGRSLQAADPRRLRGAGQPLARDRAPVGRRDHRPGADARLVISGLAFAACLNAPIPDKPVRRVRHGDPMQFLRAIVRRRSRRRHRYSWA